jgi:DNA-binding NtrC family response regulator
MDCPDCRTELPDGSKFCKECGSRLVLTCPVCGKDIPSDSKFCLECGHELKSREMRTEPSDEIIRQWARHALTTEKKEIFGDLVDRFARLLIMEALDLTRGNRSRAAKLLGLSRPTLLAKVDKYGIGTEIVLDVDPS